MLKFLSLMLLISSSIILCLNILSISGELGMSPVSTPNRLLPTYLIDITTGSGASYKFQHFYPLSIAIPIGTTVAWFNGDPEQFHTVTSGAPGASDSGKMFNFGIIPYSSFVQYTFDQPGKFPYYCQIHPWMIGSVYASDSNKQGDNFKLSTGTRISDESSQYDWAFNKTEIGRILFNVQPTSIKTDNNTFITYNVNIYNNELQKEIFSQPFFTRGNDLQLELLASDLDQPLVYGPDFNDPITGAYHFRNNFPDGHYILEVEITAVGSNLTQSKIYDKFEGIISS